MSASTTLQVPEAAHLRDDSRSPDPVSRESDDSTREGRSKLHKRLSLSRARNGMRRIFRGHSRSQSRPVLEYYDVCLRQEDLDNYESDQWLQDSNIEFIYEWLEREKLGLLQQDLLLLRPSIGFLFASIAQQNGVIDDSLLPNGFLDAKYVFIPITDNVDPTKAGGSHWSLLLVGVREGCAWYYDSLPTSNADKMTDCHVYAKAIDQIFERHFDMVVASTPKQKNGSDCGVHVLMETGLLLDRLKPVLDADSRFQDVALSNVIIDAEAYRKWVRELIEDMIRRRGRKVGTNADVAISPERRSTSRQRPSIDQRLRHQERIAEETIQE
ncbi:hypothetical protein PYCC9005_004857 [Savitreella phatthalungensis]